MKYLSYRGKDGSRSLSGKYLSHSSYRVIVSLLADGIWKRTFGFYEN